MTMTSSKHPSEMNQRTADLMVMLGAMTGASSTPMSAPRASTPHVVIYKVVGKMFAILSIKGIANVILKCDPELAHVLRQQYAGVGHRSHLDRRFWISIDLDADVPFSDVQRLAQDSYALVCRGLTRQQKAELAALPGVK